VPNHIPTQVESITCPWNISIMLLESHQSDWKSFANCFKRILMDFRSLSLDLEEWAYMIKVMCCKYVTQKKTRKVMKVAFQEREVDQ